MEQCLTITLGHYLAFGGIVFLIGMMGVVANRRHVIALLMSIELMLLAVNINLVAFSHFNGNLAGQAFTMFVLTVAAAETAIGLAILVIAFRHRGSIATADLSEMRG